MIIERHYVTDQYGNLLMQQYVPKFRKHEQAVVAWPEVVRVGVATQGWTISVVESSTVTALADLDRLTPPNWAELAEGLHHSLLGLMSEMVPPPPDEDNEATTAFLGLWQAATEATGAYQAARLLATLVAHTHDFGPDPALDAACFVCGVHYVETLTEQDPG